MSTSVQSWIRTVYLYLFALIGLVLFTIGGVRLLDMGLRAVIFTEADAQERIRAIPPMPPTRARFGADGDTSAITAEERAMLREWSEEYKRWQQENTRVDPVRARREREASSSLAMILIGLPLYLFHWRLIRREQKLLG